MEEDDSVLENEETGNPSDVPNTGFGCAYCGKFFTQNSSLTYHIRTVHRKIKDIFCEICAKAFATTSDLNTHRRTHTGERNFPCHICGQSYSTKQYLQIHTRQHTGEKPHCCEECGKAFSDPSALKGHQKQHQNIEPVSCEVCGKSFKYKKNLKSHMMVHNNGGLMVGAIQTNSGKRLYSNDFKLDVLKRVQEIGISATAKLVNIQYNTIVNWVNLAKGEHNCQICGKAFSFKAALEKHIGKHHKDGEGEALKSREGTPVSHYPERFREEVVAFAKATSQKDAKERFNLSESTVRMWLMKSVGLDYRGPSYSRSPIEKTPFQGRLQDFLAGTQEDINFEAGSSKQTELSGPLKPRHAEFLQMVMADYKGEKLTKVLEFVKTLPEEVLDKLAKDGGHKELFEAEFHFEQEEIKRKEEKKPRIRKPKKDETEEIEFKPNINEMLKNVTPLSDTDEKNNPSDGSDGDGNGFEQSDDEEEEEENVGTLPEIERKFENEENQSKMEDVKLEEDEVKMEVESESEEEELDGSKMEPDDESENEDVGFSSTLDPSVDAKISFKQAKEEEQVKQLKEKTIVNRKKTAKCEICGKFFKSLSEVERHMVTHTGARDYKCEICTEYFPLLNILTRWVI